MSVLLRKFKEVLFSVLPITCIVLLLHFTVAPIGTAPLIRFVIGTLFVVLGLTVFLFGAEIGIGPIGNLMGDHITKSGKIAIVALAGLVLGFFISVAEPDLHVLAGQVDAVTGGSVPRMSIVLVVSLGIALMMTLGLLRIVFNVPLYKLLAGLYLLIALLSLFATPEFLAISFDASGATTGAMTVPFILSLGVGVSHLKRDSKASEKDSFGLVAITSTGAILGLLLMSLFTKPGSLSGSMPHESASDAVFAPFLHNLPTVAGEVALAVLPLLAVFLFANAVRFKLKKHPFKKILKGLLYTYLGLTLFMLGVNTGFMSVGSLVGHGLASTGPNWLVIGVGVVLGLVTILAEPAVYVLTHQIEAVTSGYVRRKLVLAALSLGVGCAVGLSMVRILVPSLRLWHYLLPGYVLAIGLSFVVPKLFVGMAFDSGGVASGPMTATFILAFAHGVAEAIDGADVLVDGFGMIAMVAMMPIIALQILGLIYKIRSAKGGVEHRGNP